MFSEFELFIQQLHLAVNVSLGSRVEDFQSLDQSFKVLSNPGCSMTDFESRSDEAQFDFKAFNSEESKFSSSSKCNLVPQNTSGFPLETTISDMERSGKTGTKNPGSSLEKNYRHLDSKCSKRVGEISSKDSRTEETENKEQITSSTSREAHWGRTSQYFGAQEGILEPNVNLDYNTEISDSARSTDASESSKQIRHKRTPCMYGSGCYR